VEAAGGTTSVVRGALTVVTEVQVAGVVPVTMAVREQRMKVFRVVTATMSTVGTTVRAVVVKVTQAATG
jgi:hypothetical protein